MAENGIVTVLTAWEASTEEHVPEYTKSLIRQTKLATCMQACCVGMDPTPNTPTPTLVASTGNAYSCTIAESKLRERELGGFISEQSGNLDATIGIEDISEVNYFKSAQW